MSQRDASTYTPTLLAYVPVCIAFFMLIVGGVVLLNKEERLTRDTTRKHHLEDIETSLYAAMNVHGTYPPYDTFSWCGVITHPGNSDVRDAIEEAMRTHNEGYAKEDKPFPSDPTSDQGYFYWKRSPSSFELYAILEEQPTGERNTKTCDNSEYLVYDYGISSVLRKTQNRETLPASL